MFCHRRFSFRFQVWCCFLAHFNVQHVLIGTVLSVVHVSERARRVCVFMTEVYIVQRPSKCAPSLLLPCTGTATAMINHFLWYILRNFQLDDGIWMIFFLWLFYLLFFTLRLFVCPSLETCERDGMNTRTQIIFDWNLDKILFCDFWINEKGTEKCTHTHARIPFHFISGLWLFLSSLCAFTFTPRYLSNRFDTDHIQTAHTWKMC